jgi:hypothetical protein
MATIKAQWLQEWRNRGGVWTRPSANSFYQRICRGQATYTSLTVGKYLKQHGHMLGLADRGGVGHKVQVWVMDISYWT